MSDEKPNPAQVEKFKKIARELGCDEDEARFNENLKRIAREGGKKGDADKSGKAQKAPPRK